MSFKPLQKVGAVIGALKSGQIDAWSIVPHIAKPLAGQMEQLSNGLALQQLGLGQVSQRLDHDLLQDWLKQPMPAGLRFPDVAAEIARWLASSMPQSLPQLTAEVWSRVQGANR